MGPGQVAAVDRVQADVLKPAAQIGQLPVAPGGDVAVVLAVGYPEEVALRLGVADEVEFGCHGTRSFSLVFFII